MNSERVKVIIKIYADRYKDLTTGNSDVRDKWAAVSCCVKNWDLRAEDFGGMFEKSMSKALFLLEHDANRPVKGIVALCECGKESEVRSAFEELLSGDGGEITLRQERIFRFVQTVNALLMQEMPDKWQYRQHVRTVVKYLGLIRTSDNYMLRSSAACAFSGYCDFEEEIGYDRYLKLRSYYHMCDELAEYVREDDELLNVVSDSLQEKAELTGDPDLISIDPAMHVLIYDIIDSAYRYDFYNDKTAMRKSRISTVEKRKIEKRMKRAGYIDDRENCVDSFDEIAALEKQSEIPQLEGTKITHKSFGEGTVILQQGKYLTIDFGRITKKFVLPGAVRKGFITVSPEAEKLCQQMEDVENRRREKENLLNSLDVQLQMLE